MLTSDQEKSKPRSRETVEVRIKEVTHREMKAECGELKDEAEQREKNPAKGRFGRKLTIDIVRMFNYIVSSACPLKTA